MKVCRVFPVADCEKFFGDPHFPCMVYFKNDTLVGYSSKELIDDTPEHEKGKAIAEQKIACYTSIFGFESTLVDEEYTAPSVKKQYIWQQIKKVFVFEISYFEVRYAYTSIHDYTALIKS